MAIRSKNSYLLAAALALAVTAVVTRQSPEGLLSVGAGQPAALPVEATVRRVIDGDTVEVDSGERVRYIGVNTPESRRYVSGDWVERPEPYAKAAMAFNRRLVDGQRIRLAYDVESRDKYGRLLAYVYVPAPSGETFVNAELIRQGYAHVMTIPPNVQHAEEFTRLQREARQAGRGLWSADPTTSASLP